MEQKTRVAEALAMEEDQYIYLDMPPRAADCLERLVGRLAPHRFCKRFALNRIGQPPLSA
ncbi:hypothetical protein C1H46_044877 [Malus baccata]|uniref:Uncharacterized protein n=1 Tax=Malus baccata TaxID=106549 RepID=A0A540K5U1_MALBA|nr:hypothetical protein C1H46_044877 [Malus baccata]